MNHSGNETTNLEYEDRSLAFIGKPECHSRKLLLIRMQVTHRAAGNSSSVADRCAGYSPTASLPLAAKGGQSFLQQDPKKGQAQALIMCLMAYTS